MKTCINCEKGMEEKGSFTTGNANYTLFWCESCQTEDAQCIGVFHDA